MTDRIEPLERLVFETQRLMADHPPVWRHRNKQTVYAIACPPGCVHRGQLVYSRWQAMTLPREVAVGAASGLVDGREDVYDYVPLPGSAGTVEWHVNFADPELFVAYSGGLLAQDEMQVAEHPALGALKEALASGGHNASTEEQDQPTPVLVRGVERRCRLATDRNAAEGRPAGLYGNAFAQAGEDVVRRATHAIEPPTITNLIAMAAPCGSGPYDRPTIEQILVTAFTAFRAAALEAAGNQERPSSTVVHSGFWGCGAFGGNRMLMAILQILAAGMAGLDRLVFHTFDAQGKKVLAEARRRMDSELAGDVTLNTPQLIDSIFAMGFEWGDSDGN